MVQPSALQLVSVLEALSGVERAQRWVLESASPMVLFLALLMAVLLECSSASARECLSGMLMEERSVQPMGHAKELR